MAKTIKVYSAPSRVFHLILPFPSRSDVVTLILQTRSRDLEKSDHSKLRALRWRPQLLVTCPPSCHMALGPLLRLLGSPHPCHQVPWQISPCPVQQWSLSAVRLRAHRPGWPGSVSVHVFLKAPESPCEMRQHPIASQEERTKSFPSWTETSFSSPQEAFPLWLPSLLLPEE